MYDLELFEEHIHWSCWEWIRDADVEIWQKIKMGHNSGSQDVQFKDSKLMTLLYSLCRRSLFSISPMQRAKDSFLSFSHSFSPSVFPLGVLPVSIVVIICKLTISDCHQNFVLIKMSTVLWKKSEVWKETEFGFKFSLYH